MSDKTLRDKLNDACKLVARNTRAAMKLGTAAPFNNAKLDMLISSREETERQMVAAFALFREQFSSETQKLYNDRCIRDAYANRVAQFDLCKLRILPADMIQVITEFIGKIAIYLTVLTSYVPVAGLFARAKKTHISKLYAMLYHDIYVMYHVECAERKRENPDNFFDHRLRQLNWHTREFTGKWTATPTYTKAQFIDKINEMMSGVIALADIVPEYLAKFCVAIIRKTLLVISQFGKAQRLRSAAQHACKNKK